MALPLPVIPPQPDAYHLAPHRIKRCTFRRLIQVEAGAERVYDVECLSPIARCRSPWATSSGDADLQRLHGPAHVPPGRGLTAAIVGPGQRQRGGL